MNKRTTHKTKESQPLEITLANTRNISCKKFDLPYAALSDAQKLDLYWPPIGKAPFPVILAIHGGAFRFGDKRDLQLEPMLRGLRRGYAVVSINYRMSDEAHFPALVHDVKAAIRWIRANAEEFNFDPGRIAAWGGSAGGYLALMAGVSAGVPELDDLSLGNPAQSSEVQAVVAWFPPTNFLLMDSQLTASGYPPAADTAHNSVQSPESLLLGGQITEVPDLVDAANPETYLRRGLPPFFLQHGSADAVVPYQQSLNFAARLAALEGPEKVQFELLLNASHGDPAFGERDNLQKVFGFLDTVLGAQAGRSR